MTKRNFLAIVAVSGSFALAIGPVLSRADSQRRSPEQTRTAASRHAQQMADAYTGRIAKRRGFCVLINPNAETTYKLDDQHKARRFVGKDVIVIGTRDIIKNTIHVSEIRFNKSS